MAKSKTYQREMAQAELDRELKAAIAAGASDAQLDAIIAKYEPKSEVA
jgi:hypothetical protein